MHLFWGQRWNLHFDSRILSHSFFIPLIPPPGLPFCLCHFEETVMTMPGHWDPDSPNRSLTIQKGDLPGRVCAEFLKKSTNCSSSIYALGVWQWGRKRRRDRDYYSSPNYLLSLNLPDKSWAQLSNTCSRIQSWYLPFGKESSFSCTPGIQCPHFKTSQQILSVCAWQTLSLLLWTFSGIILGYYNDVW